MFKIGSNVLELVESYTYLGVPFHCKDDFTSNANILAKSAGKALGSIIAKIKCHKDFGYKTFENLYEACVVPIMNYCSSV